MAVNENMSEFANTRYSKSQMRRMNIQREEKLKEVSFIRLSMHDVICNAVKEFANTKDISYDIIQLFNIEDLADKIEENLIQQGY